MVYYFGTPDQVKADEAYVSGDYHAALTHYYRALETLNRYAAQPHFHPPSAFYDAVCYVNVEIAHTQCMIIQTAIDDDRFSQQETEMLWQQIRGKIPEIIQVFERIRNHSHVKCDQAFINNLLVLASETCEKISDELFDLQDNQEPPARLALLQAGKSWIREAIQYRRQAGLSSVDQHLSYLNTLESLFKLDANPETMNEMLSYTESSQLLVTVLPATLELEVCYYRALAAFELQKDDCELFMARCQRLIDGFDSSANDLIVVDDAKALINRYRGSFSTPDAFDRADDYLDPDRMDDSGFEERPMEDDSNVMPNFFSATMPAAAASQLAAGTSPLLNNPKPWLFFQPSVESTGTMQVVAAMRAITDHAKNEKFFANILSVAGDYFYKNCRVKFKNRMLMANDLYTVTLSIDPNHGVARANQKQIQRFPEVRDNRLFAMKGNQHQDPRSAFIQAIEDIGLQLEVLAPQTMQRILDEMVQSIAMTIESKNIAGALSHHVADTLRNHYNQVKPSVSLHGF